MKFYYELFSDKNPFALHTFEVNDVFEACERLKKELDNNDLIYLESDQENKPMFLYKNPLVKVKMS